jgi:hypothetical protein
VSLEQIGSVEAASAALAAEDCLADRALALAVYSRQPLALLAAEGGIGEGELLAATLEVL